MGLGDGSMKSEGKAGDILPAVGEIAAGASRAKTVRELLSALEPLRKDAGCGFVSLVVANGGTIKSYEAGKEGEAEAALAGSVATSVISGGKPYVENSITKYSGFYDERRLAGDGYGAYACLPLPSDSGTAGALCLARKGDGFGQAELARLSIVSGIVALALSRISVWQMAADSQAISDALLSKGAEVVFIIDAGAGRVIGANKGAEIASGYSREELLAIPLKALFEDLSLSEPRDGVITLRRKNGGSRFVDAKCGTADSWGKRSVVVSGSDITEKSAEEGNYRDIVESIPDIVFSLDENGIITSVNDEAKAVLRRDKASLIGAPLGSVVNEADYKALGNAIQDLRLGSKTVYGLAIRLLTKEGEPRWFEMSCRARYDPKGHLTRITGVLRDVHETRRAAENQQMMSNLMTSPHIAVLITDKMGLVQFLNRGAEELFGYNVAEIAGRDVRELYPEEKRGELDALIRVLNEKGKTGDFDTVRVRKGGETVPVHISSASTIMEEGKVVGYLEIIKDLREQKELGRATKKAREYEEKATAFKELAEAKSVFVSSVSHELRTPLTNIHGYSALLSEGVAGKLNEEQMDYVKVIHSETDRLTKLINDLLDLSRMERGKFRLNPSFFDLRDIMEKCSCSAMAERKGLYVNWVIPPEMPDIYGDPGRIAQVLINLISNAIKFTEGGGVTITVTQKSRNFVQIDVADTGPGISEEDQRRLFKPFSQIPRADGQKKEGTGLGLAISKEIVRLHNGKIWVESKPGEGAKFSFILRTTPKKLRAKKLDGAQPAANGQQAVAEPVQGNGVSGQPRPGQQAAQEEAEEAGQEEPPDAQQKLEPGSETEPADSGEDK